MSWAVLLAPTYIDLSNSKQSTFRCCSTLRREHAKILCSAFRRYEDRHLRAIIRDIVAYDDQPPTGVERHDLLT